MSDLSSPKFTLHGGNTGLNKISDSLRNTLNGFVLATGIIIA
jgi:hypothetical protein